MSRDQTKFHMENGVQVIDETVVIDPDAETITTTVTGQAPVVTALPPEDLADIRADEREDAQLARIDQALTNLKAQPRLVVSDYNFAGADVRELARRLNAVEKLNRDLIRLVRGLAAEDES